MFTFFQWALQAMQSLHPLSQRILAEWLKTPYTYKMPIFCIDPSFSIVNNRNLQTKERGQFSGRNEVGCAQNGSRKRDLVSMIFSSYVNHTISSSEQDKHVIVFPRSKYQQRVFFKSVKFTTVQAWWVNGCNRVTLQYPALVKQHACRRGCTRRPHMKLPEVYSPASELDIN